ncbi:MAG TPA: gas vesicle protein [Thermoanaerobaculia bacterium]|nr:gas vesicle protein [Thermoanaerobaculia bacterium]
MTHSTETSNLADILERVLDKGIVIAGDIKIKLVDIELLSIQIRLLIASVDKAREMGMDWWLRNPDLTSQTMVPAASAAPAALNAAESSGELVELRRRVAELEQRVAATPPASPQLL